MTNSVAIEHQGSCRNEAASLSEIRRFWEAHPVAESAIHSRSNGYDYFRTFDNLRESEDVEPYAFSNRVHGYEESRGKRVLDYGCGNGYVLAQYARQGAEVCGVDLTRKAVDLSTRRFELMGFQGSFLQTDGRTLPFDDNTFDVACSMGVLHHIPDPRPVLEDLHRVLKPGGRIIVMVYNRRSFRYHVTFRWRSHFGPAGLRGRTVQDLVRINDGSDNPYGVVYTKESLKGLLGAFEGHTFLINKLGVMEMAMWSYRASRILSALLPSKVVRALARTIGWNLYAVATKPHP